MGTTINSTASENTLEVFRCPDGDILLSLRYGSAIYVREPDLKAALGIDELGCGCDEADDNLKAAIKRAEKAEDIVNAARAWVSKMPDSWADGKQWRRHRDILRDAIFDKPAFTLPTEPGAIVIATCDETGQEHELHLYRDGKWRDDTETWYRPKDVLTDFTDHRLIGAEA